MFKPSRLALLTLSALMAGAVQAEPISTPLFLSINNQPTDAGLQLKDQGKDTYKVTANLKKGTYQIQIADKGRSCGTTFGPEAAGPLPFGKANPLSSCAKNQQYQLRVLLAGDYDFTLDNSNPQAPTLKVLRATKTGDAPLLLKTEMSAGHGGVSGRCGRSVFRDKSSIIQPFALVK